MAQGQINLNINANAQSAQQQLQKLQQQLQQISNMKIEIGASTTKQELKEASQAAMELSAHLATAMNQQTGNLDFTKFYTSIQKSKMSLKEYGAALQSIGPQGQQAFVSLANQISKAEIPLRRTSELTNKMWDGLKRTAGWQLQSSLIHGVIGGVQKAFGYAKDLNKSLTDIRIVTGSSADEMARFAQKANEAAKKLSTTTTDYTRASLIYYQQGLNDAEVKARTEATIKMANATGTSAQQVSDQMTAIWNNYADGSKALTHYADVMTALGAATASSTDEIAEGLQKFASISNTVGLSYEYAASALATITAESRESADVVGNALKTLFSRIQGLKLGETLDDGTTLNKYSTALAKVGISIKDQAGGLKDMDDILDEMGSKWDTLARDEKMALAQTVAGVRQYTQLMTLMENWDDFKKNLNVANTSTGTLDKQAAIFAESWEAASDRVRASWEGLWDNLINSEGMITILDGFSHIIQFLDQMVSGLGGAGGALLTFGGILTSVFNKQIAAGISNMAYNIKMMMPGSQKRIIAERNSFIQQARETVAQDAEIMAGRTYESKALRAGLNAQLNSSLLYSRAGQNLTPFQQIVDATLSKQVENAQNEFSAASINLDNINRERADFLIKFFDKNWENNPLSDINIRAPGKHIYSNEFMSTGRKMEEWIPYVNKQSEILNTRYAELEARSNQIKQNYSAEQWDKLALSENDSIEYAKIKYDMDAIKNRQSYLNSFVTTGKNGQKNFITPKSYSDGLIRQATSLANLQKSLTEIGSIGENFKDTEQAVKLSDALKEFSVTATHNMGGHKLINTLNGFVDKNNTTITAEQVNAYLNPDAINAFAQQSMGQLLGNVYDSLQDDPLFTAQAGDRDSFIAKGTNVYLGAAKGQVEVDDKTKAFYSAAFRRAEELGKAKEPKMSGAQRLVTGAQGLMQSAAAGQALEGVVESFKNGTATVSSSLTGITSIAMQTTMGVTSLSSALNGLGGMSSKTAGLVGGLIGVILLLAGTVANWIDSIFVSKKEFDQNLAQSDNELTNTAQTTKSNVEQLKQNVEKYQKSVEKISDLSTNPETLAEDIYNANKMAWQLIDEHSISGENYYTDSNGLIKFKDQTLENIIAGKEDIAQKAGYAEIIGQAVNNVYRATQELTEQKQKVQDISHEEQLEKKILENASQPKTFMEWLERIANPYTTDDLLFDQALYQMTKDNSTDAVIDALETNQANNSNEIAEGLEDIKQRREDLKHQEDSQLTASRIVAIQMMQDYGRINQKANSAYANVMAKEINNIIKNNPFLDPTKSTQLTEAESDRVIELLEKYGGVQGAGQLKSENGYIKYKGEGDTEFAHVTRQTLNAWDAQEKIEEQRQQIFDKADEAWLNAVNEFGENAAEAGFQLKEFGTVSGASAKSVAALYESTDEITKKFIDDNIDTEQNTKLEKIFGSDGLLKGLGFTSERGILDHLNFGTLENLLGSTNDYAGLNNLLNSIIEATGVTEDKDIANIITALSNLDFTSNARLNLQNLQTTLEDLGYSVDEGNLPLIYDWLVKIVGIGAGENFKDSANKFTDNKKALNKIKPGEAVDESTMLNATDGTGLSRNKFVKNDDDNYVFTGTQEDIDEAKLNNFRGFMKGQKDIDRFQSKFSSKYKGNYQGFNDIETFTEALNQTQTVSVAQRLGITSNEKGQMFDAEGKIITNDMLASIYNNAVSNGIVSKDTNLDDFINTLFIPNQTVFSQEAKALGEYFNLIYSGTQWLDNNLNPISDNDYKDLFNHFNSSAMTEEEQTQLIKDNLASITSAKELMTYVNEGLLADNNGIITKDALNQSKILDSSERVKQARENLENVLANYEYNTNDQNMIDAAKEAQEQYDLAQSIDAVAAARGLDAEAVALQADAIKSKLAEEGVDAEGIAQAAADAIMAQEALDDLNSSAETFQKISAKIANQEELVNSEDLQNLNKMQQLFTKIAGAEDVAIKDTNKLNAAFQKFLKNNPDAMQDFLKGTGPAIQKWQAEIAKLAASEDLKSIGKTMSDATEQAFQQLGETMGKYSDKMNIGDTLEEAFGKGSAAVTEMRSSMQSAIDGMAKDGMNFDQIMSNLENSTDFELVPVEKEADADVSIPYSEIQQTGTVDEATGAIDVVTDSQNSDTVDSKGKQKMKFFKLVKKGGSGGKSSGGGGGGGGGKEPKKVAQTRRSQVVKRYKNIDAKRSTNKNRRDNMSKKTDKLYGESRITNLQKENKLLEEGLRLNERKAEEALKNLKIDEESLRKMTKKYGYELELDSEGNIKNYEQILGDIYDQIHKLELDGELSEEEEKIKEELEIKKEEIEGAMEDWEDTLKQLEELNNEYEELIDEMHSNELEQITYKLEFELELNELDTEWYDFLNEQIGDDFTQAVDTMDLITEKIKIANENINLYKQSVTDLMENIENDPNRSLITGYLEDGVLTDEEAKILKEAYSGIIEQLSALAEAKTSAEELLVSIFEGYKERIDLDTTALEHYTSLLEHFGNVVDIVGQKQLGLSDQFMENMAKMRIQQSRDVMSAAQSELAAYEQIRAKAEEELARAREEGRTNDIDYWQQQLDEANTSIQEARDKLVTSFEDNLNAIADAFDKAVERIVQTFNDAVYAFGGLEGLSEDYSFIRENTELMAQDYEKIYELSKLNRNINKTLNDNNIIAGKQKMIELQKEINDLQASGAELSKYDLEYLQAKYELRLAEIELENAQNAKETVRLSKDSEGNWSYVYTASTEKIDEAQQKYEDALYKMQNLSYEYIDEMSEKIISASQAMMEEIQNLNKNNFENEQEYLEEINRIKAKYAESLGITEEELNKALANNEELYDKDWQSYSNKTGYAISESQNWIDRYAESTLGTLMKSTSNVADYMDNFSLALNELTNSLYRVAGDYYNGIDDAFAAAGITKEDFASFVTKNTKAIMDASTNTKKDIETQTSTLVKEYRIQADKVTDIQRILDTAIDVYGPYIREIRDILKESAALTKEQQNKDATYTYKQAAELFNSKYGEDYKIEMDAEGRWKKTVEGVKNEILQKHAEAKTDEEKKHYADMYTWLTSYILPYVTSLDTGGYTGEWGTSGRLAMLHEKELILNANDTANFLDALNVSRELVNRVIEMNARASSFGIGGLSPNSIQDFAQNLEQQVTITAEFPNAVDHNEIEEAFASLINTASQYANRK